MLYIILINRQNVNDMHANKQLNSENWSLCKAVAKTFRVKYYILILTTVDFFIVTFANLDSTILSGCGVVLVDLLDVDCL